MNPTVNPVVPPRIRRHLSALQRSELDWLREQGLPLQGGVLKALERARKMAAAREEVNRNNAQ